VMFKWFNHTKKEELSHNNWIMEVEEGWVLYNMLSIHMRESEKIVVHTCDLNLRILEALCSLCQSHFGPEGALTMGQCCYTFHITCIV